MQCEGGIDAEPFGHRNCDRVEVGRRRRSGFAFPIGAALARPVLGRQSGQVTGQHAGEPAECVLLEPVLTDALAVPTRAFGNGECVCRHRHRLGAG